MSKAMGPSGVVGFGDFKFELSTRELRRRGRNLALEQKPAEMLRALVERPGELVTRVELRARLWPSDVHLDFEHALNKTASKLRGALHDSPVKPRFIETLSKRGYRFIAPVEFFGPRTQSTTASRIRLAVLPYENRTADTSLDDLAEGLTEETIDRLGSLLRGEIRIIAMSSVLRFKGSPNPVADVARELAVDCMLVGRMVCGAEGVELKLELVAGADEARLWTSGITAPHATQLTFDGSLASEVGRALSSRVRVLPPKCIPLRPGAAGREAYLRARRLWHERTEAAVRAAIGEYKRAIQYEPAFARAYAGLAECYMMLNRWGVMAPKPSQELAHEAARKALELNPYLAEPHVVTAYSRMVLADDWPGAERAFRAAISRNPSCAIAHQLYGFWLVPRQMFDLGLRSNARALEVDPLSAPIQAVRAWLCACAGHAGEAVREGQRALGLHPGHMSAHFYYGVVCAALGRTREAVAHHQIAFDLSRGMPLMRANLAASLAAAGEHAAALEHLDELERIGRDTYVCGFTMGIAYAALGMVGRAIEWIARNFEEREPKVAFATVAPRLAALRQEPAFAPVLRDVRQWLHTA